MASIERGPSGCFWEIETEKGQKLYVLGTSSQVGEEILKTHTYMQEKLKEAGQYLSCIHIFEEKNPENEAAEKLDEKEFNEKLPRKELQEAIKQARDFAKSKGIEVPTRNDSNPHHTAEDEWVVILEEFQAVHYAIRKAALVEAKTDKYADYDMPMHLSQEARRIFLPEEKKVVRVKLEDPSSIQENIHHIRDSISLLKEIATEQGFNHFVKDEQLQQHAWYKGDTVDWEAIDSRHGHTQLNRRRLDKTAQKIEAALEETKKPVFVFIPVEYVLGNKGLIAQLEMKDMKVRQYKL